MYALAARDLYAAKNSKEELAVLRQFQQKLKDKKPQYGEFEALFLELKYSSKFTKQKSLVRYILTRIYQQNSTGLVIDPDQMTIEHLSPENPPKGTGLTDDDISSVGNLILVDQKLNNKLANKNFSEKVSILKAASVWVDDVVLAASTWSSQEILARARFLSDDAYSKVWPL